MKAVLALALLCIFQLASATQESSNLVNSENTLSEAGESLLDREARDAKKRKKAKKSKKGNGRKKKSKKSKKKNGKGKGKGRKSILKNSGRTTDQCFIDLVTKTKKFNKAQSEHRLAKRIISWGKLMKNKKESSASTFNDSLEAIDGATNGGKGCDGDASMKEDSKKVHEKLKNCATTAGANCDEGKLSTPINATLLTSCNTTLDTFTKAFKACLIKSTAAEQCSCVQGLADPEATCLDFKSLNTAVKKQKDSCTKGTSEGSFGDCRKAEREAAKFTGKCKKSCGGSMTTMAPGGRRDLLRRLGHMKFNLN